MTEPHVILACGHRWEYDDVLGNRLRSPDESATECLVCARLVLSPFDLIVVALLKKLKADAPINMLAGHAGPGFEHPSGDAQD